MKLAHAKKKLYTNQTRIQLSVHVSKLEWFQQMSHGRYVNVMFWVCHPNGIYYINIYEIYLCRWFSDASSILSASHSRSFSLFLSSGCEKYKISDLNA